MPHYCLNDIAEEISIRENNPATSGYNRFVGLEHYEAGEIEIHKFGDTKNLESAMKVFKAGDTLVARRNVYLKRASIVHFDGLTSGDSIVLRAKNEIYEKLLPFILNTDKFWNYAEKYADGTMSKRLSPLILKQYEFYLPDTNTQQDLAELLWAAENTKQKYKTLIQSADNLVKAKFKEMFGDPINNDKNWQYSFLSEVTNIVLGSTPRTNVPEYWSGHVKWVTPAELTDETFFINDTVKHITEEGKRSANLTLFPENTVIFSTRAPIGKTAIAGCPMCCNQGFKNFICRESLNHIYLYYVLKSNKDYFISLGTGTTFKELPKSKIEKIAISIPPMSLQKHFEKIYIQAEQSKQKLQNSLNSLDLTIHSLINKNFSNGGSHV